MSKAPVSRVRRGAHRVLSFCIDCDTADTTGERMDSSARLLVVDDDPSVRAMLVEYLSGHSFEVRAADGGNALRAEIERDLPDLILLDIRMPG
ncbi:MAG TPA: response regulator, partial [Caldimonas sp.]